MRITIDSIMVTLESDEFNGTINFADLVLQSTTPKWKTSATLSETAVKDKPNDSITCFKELVIGNVIGLMYPTTDRMNEASASRHTLGS